ncbi:unnamed protein product [Plutella xylostella]|uniref:(diamondback moth) hypothetical protein n=1 Tax=Plutella xylostella TaxID=51655 RepID=A0A8S4F5U0_PLUXY|nr:unnamed protein product [Plutella xylostella]
MKLTWLSWVVVALACCLALATSAAAVTSAVAERAAPGDLAGPASRVVRSPQRWMGGRRGGSWRGRGGGRRRG